MAEYRERGFQGVDRLFVDAQRLRDLGHREEIGAFEAARIVVSRRNECGDDDPVRNGNLWTMLEFFMMLRTMPCRDKTGIAKSWKVKL